MPTPEQRRSFGEALKAERETHVDLSQESIAERIGVSGQSVSLWETGKSAPDADRVFQLEDLLDCPGRLSQLLGYVRPEPPSDVITAINADPALDTMARSMLIASYRALVTSLRPATRPLDTAPSKRTR